MKSKGNQVYTVMIGTIINFAIIISLSWGLFVLLIINFGYNVGLVSAWIISFIGYYLTVLFYFWSKKDWIGISHLKIKLDDKENNNLITRNLAFVNKKGEVLFFIVITKFLGPFTSLVYMREAHDYSKMKWRDWKIFLIGYLITNTFITITAPAAILLWKSIFSE